MGREGEGSKPGNNGFLGRKKVQAQFANALEKELMCMLVGPTQSFGYKPY